MSLADRAKNILLSPETEWDAIANEDASVVSLFTGYACIFALAPVIMSIVSMSLVGTDDIGHVLVGAVFVYILELFCVWLVAVILSAITPSFNGKQDLVQATKMMVYAATPVWIAGLVSWIPYIGWPLGFAALAYSIYLIYLGVTPVLKVPEDKVAGITVVTVLIYIVTLAIAAIIVSIPSLV